MAPCLKVLALRMNVRVGDVGGVQGDEVPVGAQVGLEVAHGAALASDAEGQLGLFVGLELGGTLELDVVAIDACVQRLCGQRPVSRPPGRLERRTDHVLAPVDHEVRDRAVAARARRLDLDRPDTVRAELRMQVLVGRQVAAGDDEVQQLAVLRLEVRQRPCRRSR